MKSLMTMGQQDDAYLCCQGSHCGKMGDQWSRTIAFIMLKKIVTWDT